MPIEVVHEDAHLLVLVKPSGVPTTSPGGEDSFTLRAEAEWGCKLHPTSRLDAEVSGMVTFARTREGNDALRAARRAGTYGRGYLGLAARAPEPERGEWTRSIAIDPRDKRLRVAVDPGAKGERVQAAKTTYRVHERGRHGVALWLTPHTGRTHQLRVHAADAGHPLLGDVRYGGDKRVVLADGRVVTARRVMLHCTWLRLPSPTGETLDLTLPWPADMDRAWQALR